MRTQHTIVFSGHVHPISKPLKNRVGSHGCLKVVLPTSGRVSKSSKRSNRIPRVHETSMGGLWEVSGRSPGGLRETFDHIVNTNEEVWFFMECVVFFKQQI